MQRSPTTGLRTMIARVSPEDIVIYANQALASYLNVTKRMLIGAPLDVVAKRCRGEIAECFARPETGRTTSRLVTDDEGRVFEAKLYSDGGVLDVVLDDVTTADSIGRELRDATGTPFEALNEEELRTARHPERRYLTVSHSQLRGLTQLTDRLAAMEIRLMVNSFVEEASDSVFEAGCTVGETSGDTILGIFGAPRYFNDHPLRAVRAACDQMQKAAALHAGLYREGKELPPCSCGIWTGDTLVGTLGNSAWQHYTAIGAPVDLARRLSELARPGEIILPEHTLTHLLRVLPEGWQHIRAESEYEPDLSDFQWTGDEVVPVAEHLKRIVYLIGPGVQESTDRVEYYFDYLWAFRVPGRDQVVPILRVVRPTQVGDSLELRDDNVVTTQAVQTLGKYKLIEVVGTGGMGRVWRGVDRFGNTVAIKVLHSTETVTEAQIKRFRREAEIMARLPHRNICRVYEMNEFDGVQYLAMEFIDGLTLADLLCERTAAESIGQVSAQTDLRTLIVSLRSERSLRGGAQSAEDGEGETKPRPKFTRILPAEQCLNIVLKICDAVQFAHEHGVLHRDIKPGNILLREDGEPLVADFGLAKLNSPDETQSLSVSGHVVGTLENMAPEQAESSKEVDERADVFSIGTLLYQMLTGQRHFEATGNIVADAQALKHHEPIRPRAINPQIDPDLEIITLKALRSDPVERYRSVAALKADLEHYRRGEVISARPVSWIEVSKKLIQRNKAVFTAIAASIVILLAGGATAITLLWNQTVKQRHLIEENARSLAFIEAQKKSIEEITHQAEEARTRARLQEKAANDARTQAEELRISALAQLEEARVKAELARKSSDLEAKARIDAERQAEEAARLLAQKDRQLEHIQQAVQAESRRPRAPREVPDSFRQAIQEYQLGLSPEGISRFDRRAESLVKTLTAIMENTTNALLQEPQFVPAWVLKGRVHLALGEFDRAESCFETARSLAAEEGFVGRDDPAETAALARQLAAMPGEYSQAARLLLESPQPANHIAGRCLEILSGRDGPLRNDDRARTSLTPSEAAMTLIERNGAETKAFVNNSATSGPELIVWGNPTLVDLTPLKEVPLGRLALVGAETVDWTTLLSLPTEALDFSKCRFEQLPTAQGAFYRVKSLVLAGSAVNNLNFATQMANIQSLDLSDSQITDLGPLVRCRSLRQLDISGLNTINLRVLLNIPLDKLTLSPHLVSDKTSLSALKFSRISVIRTRNDPPDQPAAEFWRKLYSGGYDAAP